MNGYFTAMKRIYLPAVLLALFALPALAQYKVVQLYDGKAPGSEDWSWSEAVSDSNLWNTRVVYNVSTPTLTVVQPETGKANGTALIIAPGGAFHALSIDSEGMYVAEWLAKKGITCFVLKYRLARSFTTEPTAELSKKWGSKEFNDAVDEIIPMAIADGRTAIEYVRNHAKDYDVIPNRIGIMGFSAGGTVAAGSMFDYTQNSRPDFVAPVYPFFPKEMIGEITKDAPPLFVLAATNDGLGLAPHSVDLYTAWLNAKKDAELHMYARGDHGFGMRRNNIPTDQWIERFADWLGVQGLMKAPDPELRLYEYKTFETAGNVLPYRILFPENYDKTKKYPLILLLHGGGERGTDNEKQLVHGARLFLRKDIRQKFPAIVVVPQCPGDAYWASAKIDRTVNPFKIDLDYSGDAQWPLAAANELVAKLADEESVDKSRIYITGLSMGGMGTFESVYRYPDRYAAALPICGGGDTDAYDKRIRRTPFWIFHGSDDSVVDVQLSRDMVKKIKSAGAKVKYTEYPGVNHNSWDNAFAEPSFLEWMFAQKRK